MSLAQKLYEEGFITYHRTDSVNLAPGVSAVSGVSTYINKTSWQQISPEKPRFFAAKQKLHTEAHEAIRPPMLKNPGDNRCRFREDYARLYDLNLATICCLPNVKLALESDGQ